MTAMRTAVLGAMIFVMMAFVASEISASEPVNYKDSLGYKHCPKQKPDRYRICEEYVVAVLGQGADTAVFFRSRLSDLIRNTDANRKTAFSRYVWSVYLTVGIAILTAFLFALRNRLSLDWHSLTAIALGGIVLIATSFNWHLQYRAEFSAHIALKALRDRVDAEIIQASRSEKASINSDQIAAWLNGYQNIMSSFAGAYSEAFSLPDVTSLHGLSK